MSVLYTNSKSIIRRGLHTLNVLKISRCLLLSTIILILSAAPSFSAQKKPRTSYDIIIAGGGTGGISAAIQAARMGASVLVVEPSSWIGGQATAAGVSTMDDMSRQQSGIYKEFLDRIKKYYNSRKKSMGTCYWGSTSIAFEPHVGQETFVQMINETRRRGVLDFMMRSEITAVQKNGKTVTGVSVRAADKSQRNYGCKVLIDATEYGDILPLAKTQYRVGKSVSDNLKPETMIQDITWVAIIRKYLGGVPRHLKPSTPLPGYNLARRNYERYVTANGHNFRNTYPVPTPVNFITHNAYRGLPDSGTYRNYTADADSRASITKTAVNWGNDYPGMYRMNGRSGLPISYLEDRNSRLKYEREALIKTLHFIYYIQNELGEDWSVTEDEYSNRTLPEAAKDLPSEWQEIARRMPPIPYVRESRRIIGTHTLTSRELLMNSLSWRDGKTNREFRDSIAIGGYILDIHGANTDYDIERELGEDANSINIYNPRGPFQVPMNILIPADTDGLLAAEKNLSMSRIAAGALRLQPITMMTGQAAGALAAVSVREGKILRDVHPMRVQWELLNSGVSLSLCKFDDVPPEHSLNKSVQLAVIWDLAQATEYPHSISYDDRAFENPVLAIKILRQQDKGTFGVNDTITIEYVNTMLTRAREVMNVSAKWKPSGEKGHAYISRGELAKTLCEAFPVLNTMKGGSMPFKAGKHRNSEYVEKIARLGLFDVYKIERNFYYGGLVTKGELADIIMRTCVKVAGI